ncbi:MAG: hypothetical protein OJF51_004723 [Nitrospira sp.]|nr:MAG: hypothetical protein OJF51_004723 [Nitrospira sp.]
MPLSSLQSPISEAPTDPPLDPALSPALKNRIDDAQADSRKGVFRWLIFLLVGGIGPAHC